MQITIKIILMNNFLEDIGLYFAINITKYSEYVYYFLIIPAFLQIITHVFLHTFFKRIEWLIVAGGA